MTDTYKVTAILKKIIKTQIFLTINLINKY